LVFNSLPLQNFCASFAVALQTICSNFAVNTHIVASKKLIWKKRTGPLAILFDVI
jgi:hypothetical protein